jgi:uncharacterized protein YeaO (DUF488 family)
MTTILLKRVYEAEEKADGFRVLVDRLWPRGLKKETVHADVWLKEIAPSYSLRQWFHHEPEKWAAFRKAYKAELKKSEAVTELIRYCKKYKMITLLYSAKDEQHNQALVLQQFVKELLQKKQSHQIRKKDCQKEGKGIGTTVSRKSLLKNSVLP